MKIQGIVIGLTIILVWAASLIFLLSLNIARMPLVGIVSAMLLQTFLCTGLFITAHDAMHGLVAPKRKRLNNAIGTICVILYALFSFKRLRAENESTTRILAVKTILIFMTASIAASGHGIFTS